MAVCLAVSTQYRNVTDRQTDRHCMITRAVLCRLARLQSTAKNIRVCFLE